MRTWPQRPVVLAPPVWQRNLSQPPSTARRYARGSVGEGYRTALQGASELSGLRTVLCGESAISKKDIKRTMYRVCNHEGPSRSPRGSGSDARELWRACSQSHGAGRISRRA